jgi:hypothetical protein
VNDVMDGAAAWATVTKAVNVAVPPAPAAVSVYDVVCVGDTLIEPFTGWAPSMPLIVTDVAFAVVHVSVALCPGWIDSGCEVNAVIVGACVAGGGGFVPPPVSPVTPPGPTGVNVPWELPHPAAITAIDKTRRRKTTRLYEETGKFIGLGFRSTHQ